MSDATQITRDALNVRDFLLRRASRFRAARIKLAREDANAFAPLVLIDEETGEPITQAPHHTRWHEIIDAHPRAVIWAHIESGKTSQLMARILWELGRDSSLRIAWCSNTMGQAEKVIRGVAHYVGNSREVHDVFPGLKRGGQWTATKLTVDRSIAARDPSLQGVGVHGNILGARLDLLILDDILDYENTRSEHSRQDLVDWLNSTLFGRLTQRGRVIVIGTAFHPDDALHRFERSEGWHTSRFPVLLPNGKPHWPERWSLERTAAKRAELGPLEFARQMMCVARSDAEARFKREWIDMALEKGRGRSLPRHLAFLPPGFTTWTGVDLGVKKTARAGKTALFTIAVHPSGKREVLCVDSGKWSADEILWRISDHHIRFHSVILVEDNAAQEFLIQFAEQALQGVPIRRFYTGTNKHHPQYGVEGIAAEMADGRWIIPNYGDHLHPGIAEWIQGLLYYDPKGHTPDVVMASWIAREGAREEATTAEFGRLDLMSL